MFDAISRILQAYAHAFIVVALSGGTSGVASANIPPTSDAGPDQTVSEYDAVQLDGSNSRDSDGHIISYRWFQTRGPSVTLDDSTAATTHFQAPPNAQLAFRLRVEDDATGRDNDALFIQVEPYSNQPPEANAGPDLTVAEADLVQLDGTGSTDADGSILKYKWIQTRGPQVVLQNASTANPDFIAPADAQLQFRLRVEDSSGAISNDRILVSIEPNNNQAPVAEAGLDQTIAENAIVQLDGAASTDPDGS